MASFPPDFLWGVATSAYQIEGAPRADGKGPSIWDKFAHVAGNIRDGSTGDVACDHYHRWREDVALLRQFGIRAYRFSISWPRVVPEGIGPVNAPGMDFYDRLVDALLEAGIQPLPTLYHWDLPQTLQDRGGWPWRGVVPAFAEYAQIVAKRLGDRVSRWVTHNEPMVAAFLGHFTGEHAPGLRDPAQTYRAAHHLLLSHGEAVEAIRAAAPRTPQVGIALNLQPVAPASAAEEDQQAARHFDGLVNRWFLDPLFHGRYPEDIAAALGPLLPAGTPNDLARMSPPLDFLGINYYTRVVVRHDPTVPVMQARPVEPEGVERSLMWEIYPQGLGDLLARLNRDYRPAALFVTENGIAIDDVPDQRGWVDDGRRIDYLRRHLAQVREALENGAPVRGYFVWSLLDNFEWALGYAMRFGLVHVDFATGRRTPKASATWYGQVIEHGGPDASD